MARGHVPLHGHRHSGEQGGVLWHQGAGVQVGHQVGEDPDRRILVKTDCLRNGLPFAVQVLGHFCQWEQEERETNEDHVPDYEWYY